MGYEAICRIGKKMSSQQYSLLKENKSILTIYIKSCVFTESLISDTTSKTKHIFLISLILSRTHRQKLLESTMESKFLLSMELSNKFFPEKNEIQFTVATLFQKGKVTEQ